MADNAQKTPLQTTLGRWWDEKSGTAVQLQGKAVPASVVSIRKNNTIVTVKFEIQSDVITFPQVECSVFGPQWVRYPLRPGTKGYVLPADYYMGEMSGLGDGRAQLEQQANLSNGVFFPVGNAAFSDADPDKIEVIGPKGVLLKAGENEASLDLDDIFGVTITTVGPNKLKAKLVEATDDGDAKAKGVRQYGFYCNTTNQGAVTMQRIPD